MNVKVVETNEDKEAAYHIRKVVFVDEQQVPIELEIDQFEDEAIHFICYENNHPVGASRLRFVEHYGKLERICVLKDFRNKAYGKKLIARMEEEIVNSKFTKAKLHAQTHAQHFYERLGYEVVSEEFMDAGIPHVAMVKQLI